MNYSKLISLLNKAVTGGNDLHFNPLFDSIHCMSTPRVYAVLNAIVSSMTEGELYLEVGTYQGGSLIAALLGNQSLAIGVDSFEEFTQTNNFAQTRANLDRFEIGTRAELKNMKYQDFFASLPADFKIQVYNYDGAHGYEVQLAGMEAAWRFLAHDALIIVDDYTYPEVSRAVNQFIANHLNDVKIQFIFDPVQSTDLVWWNGCVVLRRIK